MASKQHLPREHWENILQEWLLSGQSAKRWCQERQINYNTFTQWKSRLAVSARRPYQKAATQAASSSTRVNFIELTGCATGDPGIYLECAGVKIHLTASFDPVALKKCLDILRGGTC
jgi:hypothetical protein